MSCDRPDLRIIRGQTKTYRVVVTDENGDLVDLTGSTLYFRVKKLIADATYVIDKDSDTAGEIDFLLPQSGNDNKGRADVKLVHNDTKSLDPGVYTYDVWIELVSGELHPVVKPANFIIERGISEFA